MNEYFILLCPDCPGAHKIDEFLSFINAKKRITKFAIFRTIIFQIRVQKRVQFWQSQKLCKNWHCRDPLDRDGSLSARLIIICRRLNQNDINLMFLTLTVWQNSRKIKEQSFRCCSDEWGRRVRLWWEKKENVALTVLSIIQKVFTFDYKLTHKT